MHQKLTVADIKARLPHREPILIPHSVESWEPGKTLTATRTFLADDPLFEGHFPGKPILPGVMMVEGIAQTSALLVGLTRDLTADNALYMFMGIEDVRFKRPVTPGDTITITVQWGSEKLNIFKFSGEITCEGQLVCRAGVTAKLVLSSFNETVTTPA